MSCETAATWRVYEINKYSPGVRRKLSFDGEWISCGDILDDTLTKAEYLVVEDRYVRAVAMLCAEFSPVTAGEIERWEDESALLRNLGLEDVFSVAAPVAGQVLDEGLIENITRRCLREVGWLEIVSAPHLVIHFTWDLRVLVGVSRDCSVIFDAIKDDGLFVYDSRAELDTLAAWS